MPENERPEEIAVGASIPGVSSKIEAPENPDIVKVLVALGEQNLLRDKTFVKIFARLDEAAGAAKAAAEKADVAVAAKATILEKVEKLEPIVTRIDATTQATNGKVKKHASILDDIVPSVTTLMTERRQRILEEETARLRREGLLVLPRTIGAGLKIIWKYGLKIVTAIGAVAIAWPVLKWLWDHRIFWGH